MMQNIETAHCGALNVFLCIAEIHCSPFSIGMNQFNHMALPNAQMSQAPMGARAASPMNHPQQMNLSSVPAVRRGKGQWGSKISVNVFPDCAKQNIMKLGCGLLACTT